GGDDHALARDLQVLQGLAGDLLGHAARVDVRRVDEVDARVDGLAHEALRVALAQVADLAPDAVGAAEGHRAETQLPHEQAGAAEWMVAHGSEAPLTERMEFARAG